MSLQFRLALVLILVVLVSIVPLFLYNINELRSFEENNLREAHQDAVRLREHRLKELCGIVLNLAYQYRERALAGEFSDTTARRRLLDRLGALRYDDGVGYFWIHEFRPMPGDSAARVVFHPTSPWVVGRPIELFRDLNLLETVVVAGRAFSRHDPELARLGVRETRFLEEMNRVCGEKGAGFVSYYWTKPVGGATTVEGYRKLAYVSLITEWNWVLGSGAYVDDVDADAATAQKRLSDHIKSLTDSLWIAVAFMIVLMLGLGVGAAGYLSRPIRMIAAVAERVAAGDYGARLPETPDAETRRVRDAFHRMIEAVSERERLLKENAEELERLNENLQSLNKVRRALLSNVSHELRTPLICILGYCELLRNEIFGALTEAQKEKVDACIRNAEGLVTVVEDLLSLSAEAGRVRDRAEVVDLNEIVRDAAAFYHRKVVEKGCSCAPSFTARPLPILVERDRVLRAVIHVVASVVRRLEQGGLMRCETAAEIVGGRAVFRIENPGLTIPDGELPLLFDPFARVGGTESRLAGEGNIDLPSARQIIEENGGEIRARRSDGGGVIFEISFPVSGDLSF